MASLYPRAFPGEDLLPLVNGLSEDEATARSFVAVSGADVVGHAVFTLCGVDEPGATVALLGPLAVDPEWQRRGIGTRLVRAGLERIANEGVTLVCVLGDPGYYGRLGFSVETRIDPPYPLPAEWRDAWQSLCLQDSPARLRGTLTVPAAWRDRALWSA